MLRMEWLRRLYRGFGATPSAATVEQSSPPPRPRPDELSTRIGDDLRFYGGQLPERVAIAWRGYLAALLEWFVIEVHEHDDLLQLLPEIQDDPVDDIMSGRHDLGDGG